MNEVSISVLSDPESTRGGEAIIRLVGVGLVPPGSTFRIDPIDDDGHGAPPEGWPTGELKPRSLRITKDGVDIVVGPDVVEAPALLPGTPVVVSVPSVSARMELRWPSLPVSKAPRRGAIVMSAQQRTAELAARAEAEQIAAEKAKEEAEREAQARLQAEKLQAEKAADAEAAARIRLIAAAAARPMPPDTASPAAPGTASTEPLARLQPVVRGPAAESSGLEPPVPPKPALPRPPTRNAAITADLPAPPAARSLATVPRPRAEPQSGLDAKVAFFVAGGLLAGAVVGGLWWMQNRQRTPAATGSAAIQAVPDRTGAFAAPALASILDVPDRSPSGQSAQGVDLAEALQRADTSLYGGGDGAAKQDAKFWLRKALALGLGDERLLWAMTQLGTLYANPDGEAPDYTSARILWEIAAANGDKVAQCFLASLYERGLGVIRDKKRALDLFERARGGTCRDAEDAITRLKKDTP